VFPVRYELDFYIFLRINSVFKGLEIIFLYLRTGTEEDMKAAVQNSEHYTVDSNRLSLTSK
jgi:hypothetical protein